MTTHQPKLEIFQQAAIAALCEGIEPTDKNAKELLQLVTLRHNTTDVAKKRRIFHVIVKKFKSKRFTGAEDYATQWNKIGATIKAIDDAITHGIPTTASPTPISEKQPYIPPQFMRSVRAAFFRNPDRDTDFDGLTYVNR